MSYIKSYKLFESDEYISWEKFEDFILDVNEVFSELMDDEKVLGENRIVRYEDDSVLMTFKKDNIPGADFDGYKDFESFMSDKREEFNLYEDIKIALDRLSDKHQIESKISENYESLNLVITLLD